MLFSILGLIAGKRGGAYLAEQLEDQQPGLLPNLVLHVLAPQIATNDLASAVDAKAVAIGATRLLCEASDALAVNSDTAAWTALGKTLFKLLAQLNGLSLHPDHSIYAGDEVPDELLAGYDATFSKLHFGSATDDDAFPDVPDPTTFAKTNLQHLATQKPYFQPLLAALQPN